MPFAKNVIIAITLLTTFQVSAKFESIQKVQPSLDLGTKLDFPNSTFDRFKRKNIIKKRSTIFSQQLEKAQIEQARNRAIEYLDQNWEERSHRFKTDLEYQEFKHVFLSGEYESTSVVKNQESTRTLNSVFASMEDLGFSLLEEEDFKNRLDSYRNIFKILPDDVKEMLVAPDQIKDLAGVEYNFSIIYDQLKLVREFPYILVNPYPDEYEPNCSDEIGYQAPMSSGGGNNVADNSARCTPTNYHVNGLYLNTDYPLKYNTTCIKDQGNRGTCVAFTINAAIETHGYTSNGKAYNISEQFTYFYGEILGGSPNGKRGRYDYGLNNNKTLKVLDNENASLQLETRWPYNPSWNMANTINSNDKWANSCNGYNGDICTNRAFQAKEREESCGWFCTNWVYTVPSMSSTNDFEVTSRNSFWSSANKRGSLDQAIAYVNAGIPVMVGFDVRNYMAVKASSSGNGYIRYQDHNDDKVGGHAFLIIGFVKNADLPSGVSRAQEEGYFIVKNSWGINAGDCGYLYVDYKYMRKEATSLHTLTSSRP